MTLVERLRDMQANVPDVLIFAEAADALEQAERLATLTYSFIAYPLGLAGMSQLVGVDRDDVRKLRELASSLLPADARTTQLHGRTRKTPTIAQLGYCQTCGHSPKSHNEGQCRRCSFRCLP